MKSILFERDDFCFARWKPLAPYQVNQFSGLNFFFSLKLLLLAILPRGLGKNELEITIEEVRGFLDLVKDELYKVQSLRGVDCMVKHLISID